MRTFVTSKVPSARTNRWPWSWFGNMNVWKRQYTSQRWCDVLEIHSFVAEACWQVQTVNNFTDWDGIQPHFNFKITRNGCRSIVWLWIEVRSYKTVCSVGSIRTVWGRVLRPDHYRLSNHRCSMDFKKPSCIDTWSNCLQLQLFSHVFSFYFIYMCIVCMCFITIDFCLK